MPGYRNWIMSKAGGWIYAVQEEGTPLVKIGYTGAARPEKRFRELSNYFHVSLSPVAMVKVPRYGRAMERLVHTALAAARIEGEWFYVSMNQALLEALITNALPALDARLAWQHAHRHFSH